MTKRFIVLVLLALMSNGHVFSQEIQNGRNSNTTPSEIIIEDAVESVEETPSSNQDVPTELKAIYNENLYVIGSLGMGLNMTNGYSFGFNTLVLKEDNLRIFFDDNSTTSSFPDNDWRIDINDSGNGGAEYFAVSDATAATTPFKIMAGAASNSFYLKNNGNVGFGTSNPATEIHSYNGDTPTLRLDQNGTSGWSPQIWDLAGNESNFFIRDVTNSSKLVFRIQPDAPSNALCIRSTGNVGIGSWSPSEILDVLGNVKLSGFLRINPMVYDTTATPLEGDLYMSSEDHNLSFYNGTEWMAWSDHQNLELSSHVLSLSNDSTSVDLSLFMDNTDNQSLSLSSDILSISGNINTVDLSSFMDNTDGQELSFSANALSISGGVNTVDLSLLMDNTDHQSLELEGNILSIEDGNSVELDAYLDNSDEQDLVSASLIGSILEIEIENGSSVTVDLYPLIADLEERVATLESLVTGVSNPSFSHAKIFNNTPNPFSSETLIPFFIPESVNDASILITNVQGIEVNVINIEQRASGSVVVSGSDISSGAYFYTLIVDGQIVDTKILVKQ